MGFTSFGNISLINFEETADIGTGKAASSNTPLQGGGSIDDYGDEQTFAGAKQRGNSTVILKATGEDLDLYFNQLKVRRGTRAKLSKLDANNETKFQYARLLEVIATKTTDETRSLIKKVQSISLVFICDSDTWLGDINSLWQTNDGEFINDNLVINGGDNVDLSSSPETHTVTITQDNLESKITTRNAIFTIAVPAGESFTSMLIENDRGGSLLFTGTVAASTSIVINAASARVLNDGVDAYDDLTITYNPLSPNTWMAFFTGDNILTFTHNGGGGAITATIEYIEEHI